MSTRPREASSTEPRDPRTERSDRQKRTMWCTRRNFLLYGGAATAVASAGALGYWAFWDRTFGPRVMGMPDHRVKLPGTAPTMVVARGQDPAKNVAAALARFGGMQQFVGKTD